jgi:arabinoxylan arabinofuranohydrolase
MSTMFQAETLEIGGQYAESVSSPFSGVALYADGDSVSVEHTFPVVPGTYRVDVTGASSNAFPATAEVLLGTRSLGDLEFRGMASSVQTLEFSIRAEPTTRTLNLTAINDNNTWDLFIDEIELTLISSDVDGAGEP